MFGPAAYGVRRLLALIRGLPYDGALQTALRATRADAPHIDPPPPPVVAEPPAAAFLRLFPPPAR